MTDVPVNGRVLAWARKERGLTVEQAAKLLDIYPSELMALEDDGKKPGIALLRTMANKYEISFAALLMPEPLPDSTRLSVSDFRTYRGAPVVWGPELLAVLDELNATLDTLADLRDYSPVLFGDPIVPLASTRDNPIKIAADERARLKLTAQEQLSWHTESMVFRRLRELIEAQGIFVYVIKADSAKNWRGLTVYDERHMPTIVINGAEPNASYRTFSLLHEYAHVLLRISAISGGGRSKDATERFCNQFAAYFLMPLDIFKSVVREVAPNASGAWTDKSIKAIADRFKLSLSTVAIHLEDTGLGQKGLYDKRKALWVSGEKPPSNAPIGHYEKMTNRLGTRHIDVVLQARHKGILDDIDAHELLDTQPSDFHKLENAMRERRSAYGRGP